MRTHPNATALVLLASHGIWGFLIFIWNDFFAFLPIYFYMGGIFAILPALRLDFARGFSCAVLSGCFLDAAFPTPFGFHACSLAIIQVGLHLANDRAKFSRPLTLIVTALTVNLLLFLSLHVWFSIQVPTGTEILHGRAFVDLIFSELLLAVSLPWLLALHDTFLNRVGIDPKEIPKSA